MMIGDVDMENGKNVIEKKLRIQLFVAIIIYAVVGYLIGSLFSGSENPILMWIYLRIDVIYFLYLAIGFLCIFNYYWKKPWNYLYEVISAAKTIYEHNDQAIELSEPLREAENQMNHMKMSVLLSEQSAKEAEAKKNELVMCLAHDIRTPLTTVIGYLSLLNEASDMPAEQKAKYVGIALDKAERLEMLINELFEISRYHTHTVVLNKRPVDLYALLSQVIDEFYPILSARGNTVVVSIAEDLSIDADPEKLARVFSNLFKNAANYSYTDTEIKIVGKRIDKFAEITISNHGKTISPGQLTNIFEKFNRLDEARLSDTGGAGLGLSIAKEIVLCHGGEIKAQSQNETISFIVTLPYSS